jgi:hypothetical protein
MPTKLDKYPVKTLVTEDGEAVVRRLQDVRYMEGRNGDNLAYANLGITNRWMFRKKKEEAERMGFYKTYMFELTQRVQDTRVVAERLLPREEDITVNHGIARSGRRGYATHTTNVGIADPDIKRLARWRNRGGHRKSCLTTGRH